MKFYLYGQLTCLLLLIVVVICYRANVVSFKPFSAIFAALLLTWITLGVISLILLCINIAEKNLPIALSKYGSSSLLALLPIAALLILFVKARSVPPIHDISTDTAHPPEFVIAPTLRRSGHNPLNYNDRVRQYQSESYPEITTLELSESFKSVFSRAIAEAKCMGWDVHYIDEANGLIEATATSQLFGFVDDIVIRVHSADENRFVDLRSASRVGVSDLGTNAKRISAFLEKMQEGF
ncbi:MAG: hypothetical protein ACI82Z_000110 [Cellvibrionaceae bacterium]|jgi:hypothetical protein